MQRTTWVGAKTWLWRTALKVPSMPHALIASWNVCRSGSEAMMEKASYRSGLGMLLSL